MNWNTFSFNFVYDACYGTDVHKILCFKAIICPFTTQNDRNHNHTTHNVHNIKKDLFLKEKGTVVALESRDFFSLHRLKSCFFTQRSYYLVLKDYIRVIKMKLSTQHRRSTQYFSRFKSLQENYCLVPNISVLVWLSFYDPNSFIVMYGNFLKY